MAPFRAEEEVDGGVGSSEGLLFKRRPLFAKADENTARSAAGRAALESVVLAAPCVLPQRGVAWRAESDERLVARFKPSPRRPGSGLLRRGLGVGRLRRDLGLAGRIGDRLVGLDRAGYL